MSWSPSVFIQNGLQPEVFHKTVCLAPKCHFHKMSWSPSVFKQNGLQPEVFHQTVWLQNVTFTKWVGLHLFLLIQNGLHKMSWSPSVFIQNGLQPEVFHKTIWLQNVTFTRWVCLHLFLYKTVCNQKSFTKRSGSKMSLSQNELVSICF